MKKQQLLIVVSTIMVLLLGIVLVFKSRNKETTRLKWWQSPGRYNATATPYPTVKPTVFPRVYQKYISEGEFNTYFADKVDQQPPERENKYTLITLDIRDGSGFLEIDFAKGQHLNGEVYVAGDGRNLGLRNVSVTGAEGYKQMFIDIASGMIQEGLNSLVVKLGESVTVDSLEFKDNNLVVNYRIS
jgi:hypothetical protein